MASVRDLLPPRLRRVLGTIKRGILPVARSIVRWFRDVVTAIGFFFVALPVTIAIGRADEAVKVTRSHAVFKQGLRLGQSRAEVLGWNLTHFRRVVLVLLHVGDDPELDRWVRRARRLLGCIVMVSPAAGGSAPRGTELLVGGPTRFRRELLRRFPRHDAVLIDTREPLPPLENLADLKYAAYRLMRGNRIAAAVPARQDADGARRLGYDFDRHAQEWREMRLAEQRDYGQAEVPHFALTDRAHGTYLRREFISAVGHSVDPVDWDDLVSRWIAQGWHQGIRTILYPIAVITTGLPWEPAADLAADWQTNRVVTGPDGRIRVIFVLQATTLSGGIRAVLELAEALDAHGLDVEIWSLEGQPTWTDIDLEVIQFVNYTALIDALVAEQAIKVATWWETAQAVWLGSVEAGVPLQYVQEFETWFYPAHPEGRAAVAASYRREFAYTTTAAFQLQELQELGLSATLIPPAFDHEIFRELPGTQRDENTLLALGRSFFQKNFAMTLAGWKGLGDRRPRLELFGFEPKIARDPRIRYHYLPSDEEVAGLYNTATCFVQTSLHEGFSLPIIEAMAAGCPVITTDSHGNRFCVDGENCIMVEQGDVEGLTRAIERIFGDAALRERLRAGGLETAKRFTWPKVVAETAEFYGRIAARDFSPKDAT